MRVTLEASASDNNTTNTENGGELSKAMPKDAQVMGSILRDMGICEWEPRVINQLLEFSYNYVTCVLDDAKQFSHHAQKKSIDVEDVRLAVQMFTEKNVTTPPSRDTLLEVARSKNISTLPIPRPNSGIFNNVEKKVNFLYYILKLFVKSYCILNFRIKIAT